MTNRAASNFSARGRMQAHIQNNPLHGHNTLSDDSAHTLAANTRSRQDKTNEDCASFTRLHRQAFIKHACRVFPGYLPPRTRSRRPQTSQTLGLQRAPICVRLPCSIMLWQAIILARVTHMNTVAQMRARATARRAHAGRRCAHQHVRFRVDAPINYLEAWLRGGALSS